MCQHFPGPCPVRASARRLTCRGPVRASAASSCRGSGTVSIVCRGRRLSVRTSRPMRNGGLWPAGSSAGMRQSLVGLRGAKGYPSAVGVSAHGTAQWTTSRNKSVYSNTVRIRCNDINTAAALVVAAAKLFSCTYTDRTAKVPQQLSFGCFRPGFGHRAKSDGSSVIRQKQTFQPRCANQKL